MNFLECDIAALDCSKYDSDILAKSLSRIMSKLKEPDEKNSDFYCGITNDVVARKSSHESQDYDGKKIEWMVSFMCDSVKTAVEADIATDKWTSFWFINGKTFRLWRFDHWAWFWSPIWRIYHFLWRKFNGFK